MTSSRFSRRSDFRAAQTFGVKAEHVVSFRAAALGTAGISIRPMISLLLHAVCILEAIWDCFSYEDGDSKGPDPPLFPQEVPGTSRITVDSSLNTT